ncbi:MAG TPA: SRPBCC family protein [Chloroflexota bacterium]
MPTIDQSVLVEAPRHEIFGFVADYRNVTRFEKRFTRVFRLPGPSYGLGVTLDARGWFRGVPVRAKLRIVEFVPDKRIVSRSVAGLKSILEWEFSDEGGGTRVRLITGYDWPFPLIPRQVKESVAAEVGSMAADSLRELKRLMESGDYRTGELERTE